MPNGTDVYLYVFFKDGFNILLTDLLFGSYFKHFLLFFFFRSMHADTRITNAKMLFTFLLVAVDGQHLVRMYVAVVYEFFGLPSICYARPLSEWRMIRSNVIWRTISAERKL